jgi:hypothetical protein
MFGKIISLVLFIAFIVASMSVSQSVAEPGYRRHGGYGHRGGYGHGGGGGGYGHRGYGYGMLLYNYVL